MAALSTIVWPATDAVMAQGFFSMPRVSMDACSNMGGYPSFSGNLDIRPVLFYLDSTPARFVPGWSGLSGGNVGCRADVSGSGLKSPLDAAHQYNSDPHTARPAADRGSALQLKKNLLILRTTVVTCAILELFQKI